MGRPGRIETRVTSPRRPQRRGTGSGRMMGPARGRLWQGGRAGRRCQGASWCDHECLAHRARTGGGRPGAFAGAAIGAVGSAALSQGLQAAAQENTEGRALLREGGGNELTRAEDQRLRQMYRDRFSRIDWRKTLDQVRWYDSEQMAAYAFLDEYNPRSIEMDREIYSIIVESNGKYAALPAQIGLAHTSIGFNEYVDSFRSADLESVHDTATVHTHGRWDSPKSNMFSGDLQTGNGDVGVAAYYHYRNYLGTPTGDFKVLQPGQVVGTRLGSLPYNGRYIHMKVWSPIPVGM